MLDCRLAVQADEFGDDWCGGFRVWCLGGLWRALGRVAQADDHPRGAVVGISMVRRLRALGCIIIHLGLFPPRGAVGVGKAYLDVLEDY